MSFPKNFAIDADVGLIKRGVAQATEATADYVSVSRIFR